MGEYWRDEVQKQYELDVHVNLREKDLRRCQPYRSVSPNVLVKDALMREEDGRYSTFGLEHLSEFLRMGLNLLQLDRDVPRNRKTYTPDFKRHDGGWALQTGNHPIAKLGETPSAMSHASGRGLAKLASIMAHQGAAGSN